LQEKDSVEEPSHCQEKHPKTREFLSNPNIVVDEVSGTLDPVSLVGLKLSTEEKEKLIKMEPCQPSQQILKLRRKQFGVRAVSIPDIVHSKYFFMMMTQDGNGFPIH
jgi:hypothetical protein